MGKCYGCCLDKVGCQFQRFWSDKDAKPCECHTQEECDEEQRKFTEWRKSRAFK